MCEDEEQDGGGYGPGHPRYYKLGGKPLEPDQIEASRFHHPYAALLKHPAKRRAQLNRLRREAAICLKADIDRYRDVFSRGVEALSQYDREICYGGDEEMAVARTLALIHNHISFAKGKIAWCDRMVEPQLIRASDAQPAPAKPQHKPQPAEFQAPSIATGAVQLTLW